jgi:hypothetical protein
MTALYQKPGKEKSRVRGEKAQGYNSSCMSSPQPEQTEPKLTLDQLRGLPRPEKDFSTPEGAILCLEDACRRRDIEAAVACKHFMIEGILKLVDFDDNLARDPEIRQRNARLAEQAYRRRITEDWPALEGAESFFLKQEPYIEGVVVVKELRRLRDGSYETLNLLVAKTKEGWRVLYPVADEDLEGAPGSEGAESPA